MLLILQTPLHLSAEHGHENNVTVLLQHGASMLIRDSNGMTPSDVADKAQHLSCINLLKEAAGKPVFFNQICVNHLLFIA